MTEQIYVVRAGEKYDDWDVRIAFTERDDALSYIEKRVDDLSEMQHHEDATGVIWQSNETWCDGYRIDPTELM